MQKNASEIKTATGGGAWESFVVFLRLGLTSFGGPVAHLGFFREVFVVRQKWLDEQAYADLVALCQFLPGPASSQVGFAIGYMRGGLASAFAAWLGFTLPSAVIMIGCAYGLAFVDTGASWIHGLKIAAVAVVAHAILGMAGKLCPDLSRAFLAIIAATIVTLIGTAWIQVAVIAMGLLIGWLFFQAKAKAVPSRPSRVNPNIRSGWLARGALLLVAVGFVMLPLLAWWQREIWWEMIAGFYQAGLLVFGGGHVVLPLLEAQTVGRGWMDVDSFLAGYGAAQALPGPLFTLAAYLGTVINPAGWGWIGGVVALIAILIPSMLLVVGSLPHWDRLRGMPGAQAALTGANAAVVGILLAAFYQPVFVSGVTSLTALAMAIAGFIALQYWKLPAWALVGLCGLLGAWLL